MRTATARTFADRMACRDPQAKPLEIIRKGAAHIVRVSDDEIAEATRILHIDTQNLAEGAGAAALAALAKEKDRLVGKHVGVILCGGNIDMPMIQQVLSGRTPEA